VAINNLPEPALLLVSILGREDERLLAVVPELEARFGLLDCLTLRLPFDFSPYYEREMGRPLWRRLAVFAEPFHRQQLPAVKTLTNKLESQLADASGQRTVNLDPGYLAIEHLVLATTKKSYPLLVAKPFLVLSISQISCAFRTFP
jgi:hypothetical protein